MAHEEFDDRVVVPAAVFKGLRAVALSGKANMLDRQLVQSWGCSQRAKPFFDALAKVTPSLLLRMGCPRGKLRVVSIS